MRYLLLLVSLVLIGCGEPRQSPEARAPGDVPAPVYPAPRDEVQSAVVRAVVREIGPITLDDRRQGHIEAQGTYRTCSADIAQAADGMIEVKLTVTTEAHYFSLKALRAICARLSMEMSPQAKR